MLTDIAPSPPKGHIICQAIMGYISLSELEKAQNFTQKKKTAKLNYYPLLLNSTIL